jgi:hypothetical protein
VGYILIVGIFLAAGLKKTNHLNRFWSEKWVRKSVLISRLIVLNSCLEQELAWLKKLSKKLEKKCFAIWNSMFIKLL